MSKREQVHPDSPEPVLPSEMMTDEDRRLVAVFDDIESKQLELIDEAGKKLIEHVTALLAVLFAVTAFSNNFPPAYLKGNLAAKILVVLTLVLYLLAMGLSVLATQPRHYNRYRYNLSRMREELNRITSYKVRRLRGAKLLFLTGSVVLAALIVSVLWRV